MVGILRACAVIVGIAALLPASAAAEKDNPSQLTQVAMKATSEDVVVTISGSQAPNFTSFTKSDPFRVVVDWAGSRLSGVAEEKKFERGLIRRITTKQYDSEAETISRVTIELARETSYHVEANGKRVLVHFAPVPDPIQEPAVEAAVEAPKVVAKAEPEGPLTEPDVAVPQQLPPIVRKETAVAAAPVSVAPAPAPAAAAVAAAPVSNASQVAVAAKPAEQKPAATVAASASPAAAVPAKTVDQKPAVTVAAAAPAKVEATPPVPAKSEPIAVVPKAAEPAKSEPAKVTVAKVEPAKVEPAKVEPAKVEPAKVEPVAKVEPAKVEPAKVEPAVVAKSAPAAKSEPAKAEPVAVAKAEPVTVAKAEPAAAKVEPASKSPAVEPSRAAAPAPVAAKSEPVKLATFSPVAAETKPLPSAKSDRERPAVALETPAAKPSTHMTAETQRLASNMPPTRERAVSQWTIPSIPLPAEKKKLPVVRLASAQDGAPLQPTSKLPADPDEPATGETTAKPAEEPVSKDAGEFDPGPRVMKYIGFQQMADVSRVFVRLDGKAKYKPMKEGSEKFVLELTNTSINVKNNERPLDTTYFNTPVQKVQAVKHGDNTRIEVRLKESVPYTVQRIGNTIAIDFRRAK